MKRSLTEGLEDLGIAKKAKVDTVNSALGDDDHDLFSDDESRYTASTPKFPVDTPTTPFTPSRWPSDQKSLKCPYPGCDKSFNRPCRLTAHERSHRNERPFKCNFPDCDKDYIEEKHLKQHIKSSHSAERNYVCPEPNCGKQFLTATRLRRHQLVHEGEERFRCRDFPPCDKSFRKHQTLQRHIRAEHENLPAYLCKKEDPETGEICGQGFDASGTLKRHQERDHGEKRFWCEECAATTDLEGNPDRVGFTTMDLLQAHMKKSHLRCMFCGHPCNGKEELDEHVEAEHSSPPKSLQERKNVACHWTGCTKTFTRRSNLNAHIRSAHEGMRFICGETDLSRTENLFGWTNDQGCGRAFPMKAGLENHIRYVHLRFERPEPRNAGSSSHPSTQNDTTMVEQITGVGENSRRTLACAVEGCPIMFTYSGDRAAHMVQDHGITEEMASQPIATEFDHTFEDTVANLDDVFDDPAFNEDVSVVSPMVGVDFLGDVGDMSAEGVFEDGGQWVIDPTLVDWYIPDNQF